MKFIVSGILFFILLDGFSSSSFAQYSYKEVFPEYSNSLFQPPTSEHDVSTGFGGKLLEPLRKKPGYAFIGSALIPGLSQAANDRWIRASMYFLIEAGAVIAQQVYYNQGKANERKYRSYINSNWSVQKYAEFIVAYHNEFNPSDPITIQDLAKSGSPLTPGQYNYGTGDWNKIDIFKLRELENRTPYDKIGFNSNTSSKFSHPLPDYDSQQYYELVAKYFQFGPGWSDFAETPQSVVWSLSGMSDQFNIARGKSTTFNDQLRDASNFITVLLFNHIVSAFDGYFTVKLQNFQMMKNNEVKLVTGAGVSIPF